MPGLEGKGARVAKLRFIKIVSKMVPLFLPLGVLKGFCKHGFTLTDWPCVWWDVRAIVKVASETAPNHRGSHHD